MFLALVPVAVVTVEDPSFAVSSANFAAAAVAAAAFLASSTCFRLFLFERRVRVILDAHDAPDPVRRVDDSPSVVVDVPPFDSTETEDGEDESDGRSPFISRIIQTAAPSIDRQNDL